MSGSINKQQHRQQTARLFALHDYARQHFTRADWLKIAYLTDTVTFVEEHPRLLRSLDFRDDDYDGHCLQVLSALVRQGHLFELERYVDGRKKQRNATFAEHISTAATAAPERIITFAPDVFRVPDKPVSPNRLAVMMPFDRKFAPTYAAIRSVCQRLNIECRRADDIWDNSILIQDVFDLIYTARAVLTDFTDRNPNVFYETGVAHTLGKLVIPITQTTADIPFDLRHHRALTYLPNSEGLQKLEQDLEKKLAQVFA